MDLSLVSGSAVKPLLDPRPARWRIGLVALATDHTVERDFARLCPSDEVAIYVNRVAFANPTTLVNLRAMQPRLTEAASLILAGEPLDSLAYACTAASVAIGDDKVRGALAAAKPGVPTVTPVSGALAAFAALGIGRLSVLTPYSREVSRLIGETFSDQGLTVLGLRYLDLLDDREIARVSLDAIVEAALDACAPEAEGIFISCTALRTVQVLERIEEELGKPVVSSNQALFWQALRAAGYAEPVNSAGRLLAL